MKPTPEQQFASDNASGLCPEALQAFVDANPGHAPGYGADRWTEQAADRLRELFECDAEVFFVFNGTAANSLILAHLCQPYHSVLCSETAHIETDECGGPEFFTNGSKILVGAHQEGKMLPSAIEHHVTRRRDLHYPKPEVVSISQTTELGTVWTVPELQALQEACRKQKLRLHMDGARFANAIAFLDVAPADVTWRAGVDCLSFGGTKNGMPFGEAIVFFHREDALDFEYRCKQAGQLASKMRFLAAPWCALLQNDVWLRHARHANAMAKQLEQGLQEIPGVSVLLPVQANAVFVAFPEVVKNALHEKGWEFYDFIGAGGSRLMCSWDTRPETVDSFLADVRETLPAAAEPVTSR